MIIDLEPIQLAQVMFQSKTNIMRSEGHHGPAENERCENCDHHKVCGYLDKFLVPWSEMPTEHRERMIALAQAMIWDLEKLQKCPECSRLIPTNWVVPFAQLNIQDNKDKCQMCLDKKIGPRGEPLDR